MKKYIPILILILVVPMFLLGFWKIFPIKYRGLIVDYSKEFDLSPALVNAVILAESGFDEYAESRVGAKGLMQVLPSTAVEISNRLNTKEFNLFNPRDNIRFGCYYLRYLLDYYGGELVMALSAYNAGLNKVNSWEIEGDIEKIPFDETKNYVKKVLKYCKIYEIVYF